MEWTLELLLFLLFNGLLFVLLPKQKTPLLVTNTFQCLAGFSDLKRLYRSWTQPPRLGAGLILDGFGSSKPSRISGWYDSDCVTYTLNIYSYVIYESNCPHLVSFFFLPPKVIYWWTSVSKQKTKELKKLRVGKEKQKHTEFCYRLVLPSCWCLKIGPCPSWFSSMAFLGWKSKSYATARTPGWSGVESTVHRPGLGMMKLSPPVLRWKGTECAVSEIGKSVMNIHFYMETTNNYTFYTMSMIHHLNSNAFLISWYVYMYIYIHKLDITFHVFINQFSSS